MKKKVAILIGGRRYGKEAAIKMHKGVTKIGKKEMEPGPNKGSAKALNNLFRY